jgi:hypothetical protein
VVKKKVTKGKKSTPKGTVPKIVGKFRDPHTGEEITVYAKEGESDEDAMKRVKKAHFRK